jgi:uncharacterized protein YbaP (TraB family)
MAMVAGNLNAEDESPDDTLRKALDGIGDGSFLAELNAVLDSWREWNEAAIESMLVDPVRNDNLQKFTREFTDRYQIWLPEIEAMLATEQREFVLINVKHLAGWDSFLRTLEESGFHVEKYQSL